MQDSQQQVFRIQFKTSLKKQEIQTESHHERFIVENIIFVI